MRGNFDQRTSPIVYMTTEDSIAIIAGVSVLNTGTISEMRQGLASNDGFIASTTSETKAEDHPTPA